MMTMMMMMTDTMYSLRTLCQACALKWC